MGIEPTQSAWKAEILPLNYTRPYQSDFKIIPRNPSFVNTFFKKTENFSYLFYHFQDSSILSRIKKNNFTKTKLV